MPTISDGTRLTRIVLTIWAAIGALILAGFAVWVGKQVRIIWLPLVFATGIVVILNPLVSWLHRIRVPRLLGAAVSYLLALAVLVVLGSAVSVTVVEQAEDLADRLPELYEAVYEQVESISDSLGLAISLPETTEQISQWLSDRENLGALGDLVDALGDDMGDIVWPLLGGVAEALAVILFAPVLAFYVLIDLPRLRSLLLRLTPHRHKEELVYLLGAITSTISRFARGQFLVATIVAVLGSLVMWVLNLPFWLIVGVLSGVLNLIPFAGPVAGAALAFSGLIAGRKAAHRPVCHSVVHRHPAVRQPCAHPARSEDPGETLGLHHPVGPGGGRLGGRLLGSVRSPFPWSPSPDCWPDIFGAPVFWVRTGIKPVIPSSPRSSPRRCGAEGPAGNSKRPQSGNWTTGTLNLTTRTLDLTTRTLDLNPVHSPLHESPV